MEKIEVEKIIDLFNIENSDELWDNVYLVVYDEKGNEIPYDHAKLVKKDQ